MSSRWNPHIGPPLVTEGRKSRVGGRMRSTCNQAAPPCCMHWDVYSWGNANQGVVTPRTRCTIVGYIGTRSPTPDEKFAGLTQATCCPRRVFCPDWMLTP